MILTSWNTIFSIGILIFIHWTLFITDILTNNFFPFGQIYGESYYTSTNNMNISWDYTNYSYECNTVSDCSRELCLASRYGRTNRVVLTPATNTDNCDLPMDISIYFITTILIVELGCTILWLS